MRLRTLNGFPGCHAEGLAEQPVEMALTGEAPAHCDVANALGPIGAFAQLLPTPVETRIADVCHDAAERLKQPVQLRARAGKVPAEQFWCERLRQILRNVG